MAVSVRAVNNCAVLRSVTAPPLSILRHRNFNSLLQARHFRRRSPKLSELSFSFQRSRCVLGVRSYSIQSLFDSIMAEFESMRKIGTRVSATKNKYSIIATSHIISLRIELCVFVIQFMCLIFEIVVVLWKYCVCVCLWN